MGAHLRAALDVLAARWEIPPTEGAGLLVASPLGRPIGPAVVDACRARGLLDNAPRPERMRFMPALDVSKAEIDEAVAIFDGALAALA
jgi:acetylornithine/N-succinyldiaminopimelate aminotransferase